MIDEIEKISKSLEKIKIENLEDLENFKKIYLSRSGNISNLFEQIINIKKEDRRDFGKKINDLKIKAEEISVLYEEKFKKVSIEEKEKIDETLPFSLKNGSRHIIKVTIDKIKKNLVDLGFAFIEGREIEDDWHNFTALNFPKNHPARDMQDTFFVDEKWSLRSQTSSAQIHAMENLSLPIKIATSGKCFRNEDISSRSHCFFHQIEVLYIDENISFVDLKNHFSIFIKTRKITFKNTYRSCPWKLHTEQQNTNIIIAKLPYLEYFFQNCSQF